MSDSAQSVPEWVVGLAARSRAVDGQPPFSDGAIVDLRRGRRELVAIAELAAALVTPPSDDDDVEAEFVVDPDARGRGHGTALLETLLSHAPGEFLVWAHGDHPAARALAASHGLEPVRELLHLVGEVPAGDTARPAGVTTFRVDADEDEWVALNALIFAAHPEQGAVTRADLEQLEAEQWFRADDFLVLRDDDDRMIGYCWLKVEDAGGEFYVVGVHPERQGRKLGGRLFEAGLARLRELGIPRSHLYVEGDNRAAVALYRSRGFVDDTVDVQYRRTMPTRHVPGLTPR